MRASDFKAMVKVRSAQLQREAEATYDEDVREAILHRVNKMEAAARIVDLWEDRASDLTQ